MAINKKAGDGLVAQPGTKVNENVHIAASSTLLVQGNATVEGLGNKGIIVGAASKVVISHNATVSGNGIYLMGNLRVMDKAVVKDKCKLYGQVDVEDNALVQGSSTIKDRATVKGFAKISFQATVAGSALVEGRAVLTGQAYVSGKAHITDNANLSEMCVVRDTVKIRGNARVAGSALISGDTVLEGNVQVKGKAVILGGVWDTGVVDSGRWIGPGMPEGRDRGPRSEKVDPKNPSGLGDKQWLMGDRRFDNHGNFVKAPAALARPGHDWVDMPRRNTPTNVTDRLRNWQAQNPGRNPEDMNLDLGDVSRIARLRKAAEGAKQARYEEGVPADPTENMSAEDAKEWHRQNDLNKDNFKKASLEDTVKLRNKLVRLAYQNPEFRKDLIPLIKQADCECRGGCDEEADQMLGGRKWDGDRSRADDSQNYNHHEDSPAAGTDGSPQRKKYNQWYRNNVCPDASGGCGLPEPGKSRD